MFNSIVERVFYHAEKTPDKLALADDTCEMTYREYAKAIKRYAHILKGLGINKGDAVVLESCQSAHYLALELAIQLLGAVFVPLEHNCAVTKFKSIGSFVDAILIITDRSAETDIPCISYNELMQRLSDSPEYEVSVLPGENDISEILFSTGTTGKEKGIVLTHKNDISLALNVIHGVNMKEDNVELIPSPLNHSHGLRRYYGNMYLGASVIILSSVMNIKRFFHCLDKYGVNSMDLVPAALSVVLRLTKDKLSDYKNQLRYMQFGAAPMSEEDKNRICELLPDTCMYNFYGSTESGCTFIYNFNVPNRKKNCIGKATWCTQAILTDDERGIISAEKGKTGLLATKGDMNMHGYWRDEEETSKALVDGIVYSNDIGYFDEEGDVILLGRKGDVINVGGNKVSPDEIEEAAKKMDIVADCGCIPVDDVSKGQVPKLYIQLKPGEKLDPIVVRSFLSKLLEPYKIPVYIEEIKKIPRSFNGKLLRKELK